jgi:hypothetical protein
MNYLKLAKFNMGKPISLRLNSAEIARRKPVAAMRGRVVALHAGIRSEVDKILAAKAEAFTTFDKYAE